MWSSLFVGLAPHSMLQLIPIHHTAVETCPETITRKPVARTTGDSAKRNASTPRDKLERSKVE